MTDNGAEIDGMSIAARRSPEKQCCILTHVSHADSCQSTGSEDGISVFTTVPFNLSTVENVMRGYALYTLTTDFTGQRE